jgi:hypothetical protein
MSRREAMSKLAGSSAALALMLNHSILVSANEPPDRVAHRSNSEMQPLRAFRGQHQPQPLRFDPAKLKGLSETDSFKLGEQLRRRR